MAIKRLTNWTKPQEDEFSLPTRDDPSLDDFRPIDSQEQEDMVRSFERANAQQSLLWRTVFAALIFGFALFLLYSIVQQTSSPWELRYHAYFMEVIDSWMIVSAEWIAILACSLAILGILGKSGNHRRCLWFSFSVGILLSVFWLYFMMRLPRFRWDVIWLPFGPLSGAGLCLYIDHLLDESSEEIRKLRGYISRMELQMRITEG